MQYRYQNPVRAGWGRNEEDYEWSSAGYFYTKPTAITLSFYKVDISNVLLNSLHRRAFIINSKCSVKHLE
jgi:hypothetical protein